MTKILMGAGAAVLLAILASYLLLPSTIVFSKVTHLNATEGSAERAFYNSANRLKWWPNESNPARNNDGDQRHVFEDYAYDFPPQTYSGSTINIYHKGKKLNSTIHFVSFRIDSIAIKWKSEFPATNNPFQRISNYMNAIGVKKNMAAILDSAKLFLAKPDNLYGLHIVQEKVKDTILLSTRWTTSTYPSTEMIYEKINAIKDYVKAQQGIETNHPMLHIYEDKGEFKNMVAIPVNKELPEQGSFVLKRMVAGKILTTVVKGGMRSPAAAMKKIEQYIDDRKIISPAIPFESLVTNRMEEKDTGKWVTKVYYPIY